VQEGSFEGVRGLKIFTRTWRPDGKPSAVVVIVHGFNSHSGYYARVAGQLVAADFAVYALDLRGRGKSEGERFYVEKYADYVSDVTTLVAETGYVTLRRTPTWVTSHSPNPNSDAARTLFSFAG